MSDMWLRQSPRTKTYRIELPKKLYRSPKGKCRAGSKDALMLRFESDFARLLAVAILTFGAVCVVALWCVFRW